ncbi:MAG TPA: error-prone DNA polymerase [Burkholderiales bacterium]|jgi:error-prone DNA polymerase|nr:error-prone DNA polymerase [Burkholderiales bacterium]
MFDALPAYAELHCLTNFTFLRGASHPEELAERAAELGYAALAITDECSLAGVVRAHIAAKEHNLKLIIGAEFKLAGGPKLVLLATDRDAYGNLSQLITAARRRSKKGSYHITWDDFERGVEGCLAILIPQPLPASQLQDAIRVAKCFSGRAWIAAELLCGSDDRAWLEKLRELGNASGLPLVAAGDVHMHMRSRRPLQDTLTAIRIGVPVAAAQHALYPNGERHLRMRLRLAQLYPPPLLAETVRIAERCDFTLDCLRYEYPEEVVPHGYTPSSYLRALTEEGLRLRFACGVPDPVRKLIEHELALIAELGYEPYFLTVYDIVKFARDRNILCQGRGSAANSAVCYALFITEVDPARMSMLFERFISRERNEPPDIDVDFEHQRREEVIQYLYQKYGRDRAALTATVVTYRSKSAIRDIGKALGLDLQQVDRLSKSFAWWDTKSTIPQRLAEAGFAADSLQIEHLIELTRTLVGFPRHLSQHTGGFVFARGLLSRMVPIENAAMPERSVIEWDKDDIDALGLLKVDVLALGMLSAIRRALDLIGERTHARLTMADIPPEDREVYTMIQRADTVGVFQIESRAQMSMLPRLKPKNFYDLVIEVAIVRPGPIQGGMVHPYLRRRQDSKLVSYPSDEVKEVLERTLGVPIFQEQVMQLAVVAAGFTPGESDRLRRSMAAWRRKGGIENFEARLISGMLERNYQREFAEQIYKQILGFGEYGFPESHAASFALLVYVSAWIKHHEPAAFLAALLNSQPMGFYAPSQLVQDARRHRVEVRPVDITISVWDCTLEDREAEGVRREAKKNTPALGQSASCFTPHASPAVRLGLCMVSGLAEAAAQRIVAAREKRAFDFVLDLARRAQLNRRDLKLLAASGALHALAGHRRAAHWEVAGVESTTALLSAAPIREAVPQLAAPTEGENLVADYASLGLTLGRHPLALLRPRLARLRLIQASELSRFAHGRLARAAGIVVGRQRPDTASGVIFVTLEDETGSVNVIVWRDLADSQRRELLGSRLMGVYGVIEREGEVVHLIARRLVDYSALLGKLETSSRDFH